jgi:hypothetical protein
LVKKEDAEEGTTEPESANLMGPKGAGQDGVLEPLPLLRRDALAHVCRRWDVASRATSGQARADGVRLRVEGLVLAGPGCTTSSTTCERCAHRGLVPHG